MKEAAPPQQSKHRFPTRQPTENQRLRMALVEGCLYELEEIAERESAVVYRQGVRDGVWMLRQLGALA